MQQFFDDFRFTRKTKAGVLALLVILILLILIWRLLPFMAQPKVDKDEIALQAAWSAFQKEHIKEVSDSSKPRRANVYATNETPQPAVQYAELFVFNPNTASEADLLRLGLPKYTVSTILKFRAKNPLAFKKKEDLLKLYTLKKEDYERIAPYIDIPEAGNSTAARPDTGPKPAPVAQRSIELNSANAEQLMSLRGIGAGYSKRILAFRNALGGFFSVEQLKEVYGFPDSTYRQLKGQFTVDASLLRKINLNIADESSLGRHPYIGRKLAANIIKLRADTGPFSDLEQLRQVPLINEEKYRKIAPYLSIH